MITDKPPAVWQVSRRQDWVLKAWPDGVVVYDEATGDIQALQPAAGEVFAWLLNQGANDPAGLLDALIGAEVTPDDQAHLQALMVEFESLGFVERSLV